MARLQVNEIAPDFTARDLHGEEINLKDLLEKGNVVLVLNRGFA